MSDTLTRLSRVLGMMGSEHDGEVLNAARMAERLRRELNKSWQSLLTTVSSASNDSGLLLRALRAENRATQAEVRASALEVRVADLEKIIREMRPASSTSSSTGSGRSSGFGRSTSTADKYRLTSERENELVHEMSEGWCSHYKIYQITGWPRAHLRVQLGIIARRHGLKLATRNARYGKGFIYAFEA